jgi:oligoendopeptidase F
LSTVGMADAVALAGRFGIDVHDGAFWAESLGVLARHVDDYEVLVKQVS